MTPEPYYSDDLVTLYLGDCREVLPELDITPDLTVADPPYADTSFEWDRWPTGWLDAVAETGAQSLWCFGSARMFDRFHGEFDGWKFSHDVIWSKNKPGAPGRADRFLRSHEHVRHYYRGAWGDVYHEAQKEPVENRRTKRKSVLGQRVVSGTDERGWVGEWAATEWVDDGTRYLLSVIEASNLRAVGRRHPTEKPAEVLGPLIAYGCPTGGLVLDPTCGSGSTLAVAASGGRRAVGIEAREDYCETVAKRLSGQLRFGGVA